MSQRNTRAVAVETLSSVLGGERENLPALIGAESGDVITFRDLAERTSDLAAKLRSLGVSRGDRVALALPGGTGLIETIFAVVSLGAAASPLNPAYTASEFQFYLADLQPRLLLLPAGELTAAREAATLDLRITVVDLLLDGTRPVEPHIGRNSLKQAAVSETAEAGDIALLLHTSGTTSRPKQVPLLHRNLMSSIRAIVRHYELTEVDVSFCAMPLFHVHGLVASVWAALAAGGSVVVPARLSGRTFWDALATHEISWFSASPTAHQMFLAHDSGRQGPPQDIPTTLRFVRSCSSALAPALHERLEQRYEVPVLEAYGMTEASHQIASNPLPPARRSAGSVGLPTGVDVRIVSKDGRELEPGSTGEVVIQGPSVMLGYLNNPDANTDAFLDGWFKTGDLGFVDADGYLQLSGRLKELIIRGGENIAPNEIEDVLLRHEAVTDAVCFGVPDEKYGESVAAAVAVSGPVTERGLRDHCRAELASFKVPTTIHILDALPRTSTGKIQRRRMSSLLQESGH